MEPLDLETEIAVRIALQPVRNQQHDGTLTENAPRPVAVEIGQRPGNPCSAGPVLDICGDAAKRRIGITVAHLAGHVGQPGAEKKTVDRAATLRQRMCETKEHPRIALHRTRNVADHDKRPWSLARRFVKRDCQPATAGHLADRPSKGHPSTAILRHKSTRWAQRYRKSHPVNRRLRLADLGGRHHLEIHAAKLLVRGRCHRHVDFDRFVILGSGASPAPVRAQRLVDTACRLRGVIPVFRLAGQRRQQQVAHLLHQAGVAPEDMKCLVEQLPVLGPLDDAAGQGVVDLIAFADINQADRLHTIDNGCRPSRHTGTPHRAHEQSDVVGKLPAANRPPGARRRKADDIRPCARHPVLDPAISACTSVRMRAASLPVMRAMSS